MNLIGNGTGGYTEVDLLALKQQVQDIQQQMAWFERAFQDHANYLQKLQAQVDRHERALGRHLWPGEHDEADWMTEAHSRLGGR